MRRAQAFRYMMEHRTICINDGELIVGEKGPAPKVAPTFPELCHSLCDLDLLDAREDPPKSALKPARSTPRALSPSRQGRTCASGFGEMIMRGKMPTMPASSPSP